MDLQNYLKVLRRRWLTIVTVSAMSLGLALAYISIATPMYRSTGELFIATAQTDDPSTSYQGSLYSASRVTSYAVLATGVEVADQVRAELDLSTSAADLASRVSAEVVPDTVILRVSVEDSDPTSAQRIASQYLEVIGEKVRFLETPPGGGQPVIKASVASEPSVPAAAISPNVLRVLLLFLFFGVAGGVGVAILRETLRTAVESADEVGEITTAPLMWSIHFDSSVRQTPLITSLNSHAPRVEAFRMLRTNLQFVDVDRDSKVIVLSSAVPAEGKTTTAVNLALSFAAGGATTLLIEGDLRRPRASDALGVDNSIGVTTVLLGKVSLSDALQKCDNELSFLASGAIHPNPAELLQSESMKDLISEARRRFEVVIIDAPPLVPVTDAAILSASADGALLVVRHGRTSRGNLQLATERLASVDAQLLGVTMNMVPNRRGRNSSYGYGYGYGYGPTSPTRPKRRAGRTASTS